MKLLEDIKQSILKADWEGVCRAYNKITGENISPPILVKEFDIKTAKKADLYKWLKDRRTMDDPKKYTTNQLRDLAELFKTIEETEKESEGVSEQHKTNLQNSPLPSNVSSTFYVASDDIIAGDKALLESGLRIPPDHQKFIAAGNNSEFTPSYGRRNFELVDATCLICKTPCKTRPENVSDITGVLSTTCETCMSMKRA